jgi:hypothetical protein
VRVLAEELPLSCRMSGIKLLQDQPAEQAREHGTGGGCPAMGLLFTIDHDNFTAARFQSFP